MIKPIFTAVLLLSAATPVLANSIFDGHNIREVLENSNSRAENERCIVAAGVSAYPVRFDTNNETVFFLTLQTLSGRNPPAWLLKETDTGSQLIIYAGRRYFKKARACFEPAVETP